MSPLLIPILALLIPIVAVSGGIYLEVQKMKAKTAAALKGATGDLEDELAAARAERERLRQRVEALEAIVTSEGYDLEREARAAGLGRVDAGLLDAPAPDAAVRHGGTQVRN